MSERLREGERKGRRIVLSNGGNRIEGICTSDSGEWITLKTDHGCGLAIDLDGWDVQRVGLTADETPLPWARPFGQRCRARREPQEGEPHWGRCELRPHPPTILHALERGFDTPRWSTSFLAV